jgi:hypothetical protein
MKSPGTPNNNATSNAAETQHNTSQITAPQTKSNTPSIFEHMMKRSAEVFADESSTSHPKPIQRMHLHEDGTISVTCYRNYTTHLQVLGTSNGGQEQQEVQLGRIAWSTTIQIRKNKDMDVPVELLVSSSIPPATTNLETDPPRIRYVQRHSRLSVPVLKSILQKSIRRRKPLPSVRVSMELADKSLEDLLRRLPIIILEDSTLHPDLPLLVWLMMAVSKDYQIPLILMKRVFRIVFEMASCPWQDFLNEGGVSESSQNDADPLSIATFHNHIENDGHYQLDTNSILIWSMLIRSSYGGMAGDILMLRDYANAWHNRFTVTRILPDSIVKRLSGGNTDNQNVLQNYGSSLQLMEWSQIPKFIHQKASKNSLSRIDSILGRQQQHHHHQPSSRCCGLEFLSHPDMTVEGVDFHCSSVLNTAILTNPLLVQECYKKLERITLPTRYHPMPTSGCTAERFVWLEGLLKSCMWKYSAGVNLRLPLAPKLSNSEEDDYTELKQFWKEMIEPMTKAFSTRYVVERLSPRQ